MGWSAIEDATIKQAAIDMAMDIVNACDESKQQWLLTNSFMDDSELLAIAMSEYPYLNQDEVDLIDTAIDDLLEGLGLADAVTYSIEELAAMDLLEQAQANPLECMFCKVPCIPEIVEEGQEWDPDERTWIEMPVHISHKCSNPDCHMSYQRLDEQVMV